MYDRLLTNIMNLALIWLIRKVGSKVTDKKSLKTAIFSLLTEDPNEKIIDNPTHKASRGNNWIIERLPNKAKVTFITNASWPVFRGVCFDVKELPKVGKIYCVEQNPRELIKYAPKLVKETEVLDLGENSIILNVLALYFSRYMENRKKR